MEGLKNAIRGRVEGLSDDMSDIYTYFTGVPSEKHRLFSIGLQMEEEAVNRYIHRNPAGEPSIEYEPLIADQVVHLNRAFINDVQRSIERHSIRTGVVFGSNRRNMTAVELTYEFTGTGENGHAHRYASALGHIYITKLVHGSRRAYEIEPGAGFYMVKFKPVVSIPHVAKLLVSTFKGIHEAIKRTIRRLSYIDESTINRVEKQIEALEEARPNVPQNLRQVLGEFLAPEAQRKERAFFSGKHTGVRRVGNVGEVLNRLTKKQKRGGKRGGGKRTKTRRDRA